MCILLIYIAYLFYNARYQKIKFIILYQAQVYSKFVIFQKV